MKRFKKAFCVFLSLLVVLTSLNGFVLAEGGTSTGTTTPVIKTVYPNLSWQDVTHDQYKLYLSKNSDFSNSTTYTKILNNQFTVPGKLDYATKYYWKVEAVTGDTSAAVTSGDFTTASSSAAALYSSNLEDAAVDAMPAGWTAVADANNTAKVTNAGGAYQKAITLSRNYTTTKGAPAGIPAAIYNLGNLTSGVLTVSLDMCRTSNAHTISVQLGNNLNYNSAVSILLDWGTNFYLTDNWGFNDLKVANAANVWYNYRIVANLNNKTFDIYINNVKANTQPISFNANSAITQLAISHPFSDQGYTGSVSIDNVSITHEGPVPQLVAPAPASTGVATTPEFSWTASGASDTYTLVVDDNADFTSPEIIKSGLTTTSCAITADQQLAGNTTYYWKVLKEGANGGYAADTVNSFTTLANATSLTSYYVAPDGDDNNPGTLDKPFKTIQKARDAVRTVNASMTSDIVVYLRGGTYQLDNAIDFNESDSGSNNYNVKYVAYNGEKPVISGGVPVTGWTIADAQKGIYSADVPAGSNFRQFYVNGKRATVARTPNVGSYNTVTGYDDTNKKLLVKNSDFNANWSGFTSSVQMVHLNEWVESYLGVGNVEANSSDSTTTWIIPKGDSQIEFFARFYPERRANMQKYYWQNSYDFLDAEGEWFLNTTQNKVYYKLRAGEDISTLNAEIPKVNTLINLQGTSTVSRVHNIEFDGITFAYTNWTEPNAGYVDGQAGQPKTGRDYGFVKRPGSPAVYLKNAQKVNITKCNFTLCGSTGLDIFTGVSDTNVKGNTFTDIAGNGIIVSKLSDYPDRFDVLWNPKDPNEPAQNIYVENNYFERCAQDYYGSCGITVGYAKNSFFRHNEICDMPYSGISIGWGWYDGDSAMTNNSVDYNHIYNVCRMLADGGGIYTLSRDPNSTINGNYVHDLFRNTNTGTTYPIRGVYLDAGTNGYTIKNNVFRNIATEGVGGVTKNCTIESNESQDSNIIANAGLEPAYRNILPTSIEHASNTDWVAPSYCNIRLSGTVALKTAGSSLTVSINKNGTSVWSGTVSSTEGIPFNLAMDLAKDDVISFTAKNGETAANDQVIWNSLIVKDVYPPDLSIKSVTVGENQLGEAEIDNSTCTVNVKVKEGTNLTNITPNISVPLGTTIEPGSGVAQNFSKPVNYRVLMEEGTSFAGERKYRDWKINVIEAQDNADLRGYNIEDQIADAGNWFVSGGTKKSAQGSITFDGGYATYQAKTFENELLEFNMKSANPSWPCIILRNQSNTGNAIGSDGTCYVAVINSTGIELQRFNNGKRTVFYGNVQGFTSMYGDAVTNTAYDNTKDNLIQAGAINTPDGVRLIMYINGKKIFDCLDNAEGKITAPGYFGTYQSGNIVRISNAPKIVNISNEIADTNNWYVSGGTKSASSGVLTLDGGYATYQGKSFQDEMLEFNMSAKNPEWPCIVLRNQSSTADALGNATSCYIVVVKPAGIELQRFNNGKRTVFYGNVSGFTSIYGDAIPNTAFDYAKDNNIRIGAFNTQDGVRLLMYVNGKLVFDCLDNAEGKITAPGYFGTYEIGNIVKLSSAPVLVNLGQQIADINKWNISGGTKTSNNGILTLDGGYATYGGKTFQNELLEFNMNSKQVSWPCIVLRNQSSTADALGKSTSCYIVVVNQAGIELQRFNNGARTLFYGNVSGFTSIYGDAIPNTAFNYKNDNLVRIGAINTANGVRLLMYINGKKIFDCIDTAEGKITAPGYFGTYQMGNVVRLSNGFIAGGATASDAKQALQFEISKANGIASAAVIGNNENQYPLWAKEYLQKVIADAQAVYDNQSSDAAAYKTAKDGLVAAEGVFEKAKNSLPDVALNKTTTSSENGKILDGFGPDKAVDGAIGSGNGWSAESGVWTNPVKPWLQVDLGAQYEIKRVEVVDRPSNTYDGERKNFEIQASNDPSFATYEVLGAVGNEPFPNDSTWQLNVTSTGKFRYVRYAKTAISYAFVSEFRVLGNAVPEKYTIGGKVSNGTQPVADATVNLYSYDNQSEVLGTATTAADGTYTIADKCIAGKYLVKLEKQGYSGSSVLYVPYAAVADANINAVITEKQSQAKIIFSDINKVYGDAAFECIAQGGSGTGKISYTSSDTSVATINPVTGEIAILKAGTTTLTATKAGDADYKESSASCTLTVAKKTITATATANSKQYDGNNSATGTVSLNGILKADEGQVTGSATFAFADSNAGTAKMVIVNGIELTGTASGNYSLESDSITTTADISRAVITITGVSVTVKNYGKKPSATVSGPITFTGKLGNDDIAVTAEEASFSDISSGKDKMITVSGLKLTGTASSNYNLKNDSFITTVIKK